MDEKQNSIRLQLLEKLKSSDCPNLSDEEKEVLNLRWGLESQAVLPLWKVAEVMSKSREYVRQTEQQALIKLRFS